MEYQDLKPVILKALLRGRSNSASKKEILDEVSKNNQNVKGIINKALWAVRELTKEGEIFEKDGELCINKKYQLEPQPILDAINFLGRRFEQECKEFLSHMGFTNIRITGKTGDQGIDGKAQLALTKSLIINFLFQCKSGKSNVGSPAIREFRGSLATSTCLGIVFAQNGFTRDAIKESSKKGPQQLFLFDKNNIAAFYRGKYLFNKNET
ncbi:MAG: restriction endonuclease [Chlamydiia bacterium]